MLEISSLNLALNHSGAGDNTSGRRLLFKDLTFTIKSGKIIWFTGSNGVGKTTILKLLAGLISADEGDVCYNNSSVINNSEYRKRLIYLASPLHIRSSMKLREYLKYLTLIYQYHPLDIEYLKQLKLHNALHTRIDQLSSGQRQRVGLLALYQTNRDVYLLDEPYNHIDDTTRSWLDEQFFRLSQENKTIVIVSHRQLPNRITTLPQFNTIELSAN